MCSQEGQLLSCLGSSQNVGSCPCSTQALHSLPTCAPALAFPRQAQHSRDGLGILEMPPVEARAGRRQQRDLGAEEVDPLRPAIGSWRTQGPTCVPRNDDISGEELGLQWAAPLTSAPFHGLVTPTMCMALVGCWDPSERGPVPNFVEFIVTSEKTKRKVSSVKKPAQCWNKNCRGVVAMG